MEAGSWSDRYTPAELAAALDHHAAKFAKLTGNYPVADEMRDAAACIRDLSAAGSSLVRNVLAAKESLTRLP